MSFRFSMQPENTDYKPLLQSIKNYFLFKILILSFIFSFVGVPPGYAQISLDKKIRQNRSLLKEIESQIEKLRLKIFSARQKEAAIVTQIELLDHEMSLIIRSKGILEQEIRLLGQKIENTKLQLKATEKRLQKLKELYARRAVYSYKYGRARNLELLLTSNSINQALIRLKYLKQIANHDETLMKLIKEKKAQIQRMKAELELTFTRKTDALSQIRRKAENYLARKSEKEQLLKKLKWTQSTYQKQLSRKDQERRQILNLILSLEKERKSQRSVTPKEAPPEFNFQNIVKARGKLPWPVKGKVITHYGKQRDPDSRTYIKNTDIEITAPVGTPVRCVFPGVVRIITYLPGYGNTIIVDHGKGYYSVYSHLAEIYVYKNSYVEKNQILGKVGESGYIGPVSLRFGIYGNNKTYNPENWLE
ncbi:MAG: peptidoglycan DD-metalloendopeptidase family protein [Calditrichaeota bacterium]|nr:peptidoglycan DD-metalloendopeptidase family protein [Calditrichota bacterium]